jgi:hypothetical protein
MAGVQHLRPVNALLNALKQVVIYTTICNCYHVGQLVIVELS